MTMLRDKVKKDTEVEMSKRQWLHKSKDKRNLDLKLGVKSYVIEEATEITGIGEITQEGCVEWKHKRVKDRTFRNIKF